VSEISKNKIKWIRSLQKKKTRDEEGLFIIEGEKIIEEVLTSFPDLVHTLIHTADFSINSPLSTIESYCVKQLSLEQASGLKTPNKALAVIRKPKHSLPDLNKNKLILALDGIQDPGNMGTILRIADWFGIEHVLCSNSTVEVFNPKVIQSSMGAFLRIKVHYIDLKSYLSNYPHPIYGALLNGQNIYETTLFQSGIIVFGNEGNGITPEIVKLITHRITIPKFGNAESLNVSVAAGIIVSEFKRTNF
jgi:TrmH family RNA methyltransferase